MKSWKSYPILPEKNQIRLKGFTLFFIRDKWMNLKKWSPGHKTDTEVGS